MSVTSLLGNRRTRADSLSAISILQCWVERDSRRLVQLSRRQGARRFEHSPTELAALISMVLGRSQRCRQSGRPKKERATRSDRPRLPPECGATPRVPRFTPYLGVTTAKYCASTTQSARLRGLLRHATANSAIHTVVPRKQHLSRFDPPKHPLWTGCQTAYKPGSVPSP